MNNVLPFIGFVAGSFAIVYGAIPIIFRKEIAQDKATRSYRFGRATVELAGLSAHWTLTKGKVSTTNLYPGLAQTPVSITLTTGLWTTVNIRPAHATSVILCQP